MTTLTYVYADSTAVLGPLAQQSEPHSYDLCDVHASRLTVPRGWEIIRIERADDEYSQAGSYANEAAELVAMADAVFDIGNGPAQVVPGRGQATQSHIALNVPAKRDVPAQRGHLRILPEPTEN